MDWAALTPRIVHPTKVLVIEAMLWIDQPMSASELDKVLETEVPLKSISYHVKFLADLGVFVLVRKRRIRGAWEKFYYFAGVGR